MSNSDIDDTEEDEPVVYQVTHADEYGFGGYTNLNVLVDEETPEVISGWVVGKGGHVGDERGNRINVVKNNLAAWEELESWRWSE